MTQALPQEFIMSIMQRVEQCHSNHSDIATENPELYKEVYGLDMLKLYAELNSVLAKQVQVT